MPNLDKAEYSETNIDESFQSYKNQSFKLGYNIKLDNEEVSSQRRVISKVIKFDENNQYGFAMTKPMPVGAIKEKDPSWTEYNILFEKVSLNDKKGHIFIVDIEFDYEHATDRQMYNEILPPFIEKDTKIKANKKSVYQLLELYSEDKNGNPNKYKVSAKAHANMLPKMFIPLYLEEIKFGVLRCGWKVTKLHKHYYFDQERCKKNFILMNQKVRQEATDKVESDFCKLLNNANFGYDCRNNLDKCFFEAITDEIKELTFIKRYHKNLYDESIRPFITSRVLSEDIQERYNYERQLIKEDDKFYAVKIRALENRRRAETEAFEAFKRKEKKHHQRTGLYSYADRLNVANKDDKVKSIIDFSDQDSASIKALAIKKKDKIKITTRFMKGKMLMFSKVSLRSFVYDIIDTFSFPDDELIEIYNRHDIIKVFIYLILTDTDSCSLQLILINKLTSTISENEARDLIFKILLQKLGDRLDTSHEFFDRFSCRDESIKKKVGLYEVESIDNANLVTIAANPKEYIEIFKTKDLDKKYEF